MKYSTPPSNIHFSYPHHLKIPPKEDCKVFFLRLCIIPQCSHLLSKEKKVFLQKVIKYVVEAVKDIKSNLEILNL